MSDTHITITAEMWMALVKRLETLESRTAGMVRLGPQPDDPEKRAHVAAKIVERFADRTRSPIEVPADVPPVDITARALTDGSPVTEDHREILTDGPRAGQQKAYVVLSEEERNRGFVRPLRDAYRHIKCGHITTMGRSIAETYARHPQFYTGTFCSTCRGHFPVGEDGEFVWYENDGTTGPKVGT